MAIVARAMSKDEKLALIRAHPDLAGRLALTNLTAQFHEGTGTAGLDRLTAAELARFTELDNSYKAKFGFPFIMAVKGATKDDILAAFERRIGHAPDEEFNEALTQIEKIALLRLRDRLPA